MSDCDIAKKLKDALIFETAWLYETMETSQKKKEMMLEAVKVIWNQSIQRAGFSENFYELVVDEDDFKKAAQKWFPRTKKCSKLKD